MLHRDIKPGNVLFDTATPVAKMAVASVYARVGSINASLGETASAAEAEAYQQSIARYGKLIHECGALSELVYQRADAQTALGELWKNLDRIEDAERVLQEAIESTEELVSQHPDKVAYRRLHVKQLAGQENDLDLVKHYQDRSVASLRQAIEGGYTNLDSITTHPDLKTLLSREDVQELLKSIQ